MKIMEKAIDVSENFIVLHEEESQSNCFVMAKMIKSYDVQKVVRNLRVKLQSMITFFMQSHDGLFCALCDARSYPYIDLDERTFTLKGEYCEIMI